MKNSFSSAASVALSAAVLTAAIMDPARATVTWSFFETSISCLTGECTLPPQRVIFATLTLSGPISEGNAFWPGFGMPVYTGDEFILFVDIFRLSPAFNGNQGGQAYGVGSGRLTICDFDISWSVTASSLGITTRFDAIDDNIGLAPFGGPVATDGPNLGGCNIFTVRCVITAFWQSDLDIPEPSSSSLILAGLLGAWLGKRCRRLGSLIPR
jgi:hypothetical protein